MFKPLEILEDNNKVLRQISEEVVFPLDKSTRDLIKQGLRHLRYSQIEKYYEKYDLRPGMGLAFVQLGILKRIILIVYEYEEGKFEEYVFINPKITSHSVEEIAAEEGEGCLSVNREIDGHVKRYARITVSGFDEDGNQIEKRARDVLSIAFQHEIDHLNGFLFYDRIDKFKKHYTEEEIRLI